MSAFRRTYLVSAFGRTSVACLCLLAFATPLVAQRPKPDGFINDFAGILDAEAKADLQAIVRDTEQKTTAEIAVATVQSLDGMSVEEYASRLFKEWGIGKKGQNNGILVLVAPSDRKMRIEVGYGLEPILPDGLAGEIIRTDFLPQFRNGDFQAGIRQGVRHVADIVRLNHVVTDDERRQLARQDDDRPPALLMIPFFGIFIGLGAFTFGLGLRSKTVFPLMWGGFFGGIPFLMSLIPFFNASVYVLGPLALGMFALGWSKGSSPSVRSAFGSGSSSSDSSEGWLMGTSSSSSSSSSSDSSSSSSSSDSFGGGSSGGGGASGSW